MSVTRPFVFVYKRPGAGLQLTDDRRSEETSVVLMMRCLYAQSRTLTQAGGLTSDRVEVTDQERTEEEGWRAEFYISAMSIVPGVGRTGQRPRQGSSPTHPRHPGAVDSKVEMIWN